MLQQHDETDSDGDVDVDMVMLRTRGLRRSQIDAIILTFAVSLAINVQYNVRN